MDEPRSEPSPKPAAGTSRRDARAREVALRRRRAAALGGGRAGGADRRADRRRARRPAAIPTGGRPRRPRSGSSARSSGWPVTARTRSPPSSARTRTPRSTRRSSYTPAVRMAGTQHRELALTFDDGPGPYTLRLLRVLRRMHTPATFFEVGVGLAVLPRRHLGDRQARLSDRRSHLEPSRHGRAVTCPAAGRAAASRRTRSDATARRSRGCSARRTATGTRPRCSCCARTTC